MNVESRIRGGFAPVVESFASAQCTAFAACLARISADIDPDEARLFREAAEKALHASAALKLNRVLLLELHAARLTGQAGADDTTDQFARFVQHALTPGFAAHLDRRYPPLRPRLHQMLERQRLAIEALLARFIADREALVPLIGGRPGRLTALTLGQGDLHAGGQSVARLAFENGAVMYKPRSLRVDGALDSFLAHVFAGDMGRIRVPEVIDRGDYGWAAFVAHRYCDGEDELRTFYRGLGRWLAVLRLLGGTDIHFENLIAVGPTPIAIDVESLFTAVQPLTASGCGEAHDLARKLIQNSVLRTGMVPFRAPVLGFDNVDLSAAGSLKGEQPQVRAPIITGDGTVDARVQIVDVDIDSALNHPSPDPELHRYWEEIGSAFLEATEHLRRIDADGELASLLAAFEGCRVREIRRATMVYSEIGRMLWHPAALHNEADAVARARDLFARNSAASPIAPSSPAEIADEVDDLRHGDVPVFVARLTRDGIDAALADWRRMRAELEEILIRSALVVTRMNDDLVAPPKGDDHRRHAHRPHVAQLDARRRKLAAQALDRLLQLAVRGDDGSVTWIAPEFRGDGWRVQPLQPNSYSGLGGIAVALAGYRREVDEGRADFVAGVEQALDGTLHVLDAMIDTDEPRTVGGFSGLGSDIWSWVALYDLLGRERLLANAVACAGRLEREGFEADAYLDVMDGCCGAIVPLIGLAGVTADHRWLALAARAGRHAVSSVSVGDSGLQWSTIAFPEPTGGFMHGATGIAWSLTRLALAGAGDEADRARWKRLADAIFAFQDSLFDDSRGTWDNRRSPPDSTIHAWCNGSVGIGLAAGDLYVRGGEERHLRDLRRATAATQHGWGITHTLCHGDFSLRELIMRASVIDPESRAIDRDALTARVISALEEHYVTPAGMIREAYTPGLMTGLAGVIHSLIRMHPDSTLASPLLFERDACIVA
jgi:type 2 lantibiotic biosynthesis protein LanM